MPHRALEGVPNKEHPVRRPRGGRKEQSLCTRQEAVVAGLQNESEDTSKGPKLQNLMGMFRIWDFSLRILL